MGFSISVFGKEIFRMGDHAQKASRVAAANTSGSFGEVRWSEKNMENYAKEAYFKCVIAYACALEIARLVSFTPWKLMRKESRTRMKEVDDHPILDLLDRPNADPQESWSYQKYCNAIFLTIMGECYFERVKLMTGTDKSPKELYILNPTRMNPLVDLKSGLLKGYEYRNGLEKVVFPVDPLTGQADVLMLKHFNPTNQWRGSAPTETAARDIDTDNEGTTWNMKLLQNAARPGLIVMFSEQVLTDELYAQLKADLKANHAGGANAGESLILHGQKPSVERYGFTPIDMDFVEGGREKARRIALAFGVPPMLLGIPGDNTYSNYEAAMLAFVEGTGFFYLNLFASAFSGWMFRPEEKLVFVPDEDRIPALEPRRKERWEKASKATWLKIDEKRALTGYDALDGGQGDVVMVPATEVPLEIALEPPEPEPAPVSGGGGSNAGDDED